MRENYIVARIGEHIIKDILPKSQWENQAKGRHFDIHWKGLKIDVKTSRRFHKEHCLFNIAVRFRKIIYIYVGLSQDKIYYWISKGRRNTLKFALEKSLTIEKVIKFLEGEKKVGKL